MSPEKVAVLATMGAVAALVIAWVVVPPVARRCAAHRKARRVRDALASRAAAFARLGIEQLDQPVSPRRAPQSAAEGGAHRHRVVGPPLGRSTTGRVPRSVILVTTGRHAALEPDEPAATWLVTL
jgi:hypothetical protein